MTKKEFLSLDSHTLRVNELTKQCYKIIESCDRLSASKTECFELLQKYFSITRNLNALGLYCGSSKDSQIFDEYLENMKYKF